MIDPNGGFVNNGGVGRSDWLGKFRRQRYEEMMSHTGYFSWEKQYTRYKEDLAYLYDKLMVTNYNEHAYLEALLEMNNKYLGTGMDCQLMASGMYDVSANTRALYQDLSGSNLGIGYSEWTGSNSTGYSGKHIS